jgi:hypothetical protein
MKQYREKNKEAAKKYAKQYNEDHKQKGKENKRRWYEKNKEKVLERTKQYYENNRKKYQTNDRTIGKRFNRGKSRAKIKNIPWNIEFLEYEQLAKKPCAYCGYNNIGQTSGLSLDRIDSNKGYTSDNVLPCCGMCNIVKNVYNISELLQHLKKMIPNLEQLQTTKV